MIDIQKEEQKEEEQKELPRFDLQIYTAIDDKQYIQVVIDKKLYKIPVTQKELEQNIVLNSLMALFEEIIDKIIDKNSDQQKNSIIKQHTNYTHVTALQYYLTSLSDKQELQNQNCGVCCSELYELEDIKQFDFIQQNYTQEGETDAIYLNECPGHFFHINCLETWIQTKSNSLQCPVCNQIYGALTGDMSEGNMNVVVDQNLRCAGYNSVGTIIITYKMKGGTRNGRSFQGTTRIGYLPNNQDGQEILQLLKRAFDQKLTFTVGTSITTGAYGVVWASIHHQTSLSGGSSNFGYPDPTYFQRVRAELKQNGIY